MDNKDKYRVVPRVKTAQWREGLPEGYDVCDDRKNDYQEVDYAIVNAKEFQPTIPKELGVFKVMQGKEALEQEPKPTEMIIDTVLPMGFNTIIAGTTGSNKSYFAMQLGMSIANGEDDFLGWTIRKKGYKVLYVDTECGTVEMHRRFKRISKNMNWKGENRFNFVSKHGKHADIWEDLHRLIEIFRPNIIIIDCLYNSSIQRDFTKGYRMAQVTDQMTYLKDRGFNVIAVHHFNKGNHDQGLIIDRMSGASALQNWVEHQIMLTKTNELSLRLMRIVKSRGIDFSDQYYGITWDSEIQKLSMRGIITNVQELLVDEYRKKKWIEALERMPDPFETKDFLNVVVNEWNYSERTAKSWLKELVKCEMLIHKGHGIYEKKLVIVDDIISAET